MVQQAIRAWQVIKCIKAQDLDGLRLLPEWAMDATINHRLFMSNEDFYTGLWVQFPLVTDEIEIEVTGLPEGVEVEGMAMRAAPEDILVYRGMENISVWTNERD